jgi:hypothetical protein
MDRLGVWRSWFRDGVGCGKRLRNLQQGVALPVCHRLKAFKQVDCVTLGQQPDAAGDDRGVYTRCGVVMAVEIADVHIESYRDVPQPARRDTIRPSLVFLDLLERDAELVAEFGLTHAELPSANADSLPDLDVERRSFTFPHWYPIPRGYG